MSDLDSVGTFVNEAESFYGKHSRDLGHIAATWGGLTWGLLRAIAECPNCPGSYRRPLLDFDWDILICPTCGKWWTNEEGAKKYEKLAQANVRTLDDAREILTSETM